MMSARSFVLSALTAVAAWPVAAAAQERQPTNRPRIYVKGDTSAIRERGKMVTPRAGPPGPQPPPKRPRIYVKGDPWAIRERVKMVTQRRARLGINISTVPSANDSIGATI